MKGGSWDEGDSKYLKAISVVPTENQGTGNGMEKKQAYVREDLEVNAVKL